MEKQILHIDCNKFYASVECLLHPELKGKPVAVGGNEESRHGIILTKNEIASKYGLVVGAVMESEAKVQKFNNRTAKLPCLH